MSKKNKLFYVLLFLKGVGMGAADVIPGVSGGTIAFISGIYEELLQSIKSVNLTALKLLFSGKLKAFWRHINGTFLFVLISGIGLSILTLARLMTYLLQHHEILVWSTFFGLVGASAFFVAKKIKKWTIWTILASILFTALAYWITDITPTQTPENYGFIFLCGFIAIIAMILPGISGSFILLLLGKYFFIMHALHTLNIPILAVFVVGVVLGIITFSHLLTWLLKHYFEITIAILFGFMIGSLNKIWPWKKVVETFVDDKGFVQPLVTVNTFPTQQVLPAITLCIIGALIVILIEYISSKQK